MQMMTYNRKYLRYNTECNIAEDLIVHPNIHFKGIQSRINKGCSVFLAWATTISNNDNSSVCSEVVINTHH